MNQMKSRTLNVQGFTLVELLIAMVISVLVIAGAYSALTNQRESYIVQDDVTTMQQNIRSGIFYLEREIKLAGYNPDKITDSHRPSMTAATSTGLTFEKDDETGTKTTEEIAYSFDAATRTLLRDLNGAGGQPVSEQIEAIGFAYAYDADDDGAMDTYLADLNSDGLDNDDDGLIDEGDEERQRVIWAVPNGGTWFNLDSSGPIGVPDGAIDDWDSPTPGTLQNETLAGSNTGDSFDSDQIRAVRISLLARTNRGDRKFSNNFTYFVGDQEITPQTDGDPDNDTCRMRLFTTIAHCRNMGLIK